MAIGIKDPSQVFINIMGFNVEGFSKGTFVAIETPEQNFSQRVSLRGRVKVFNNKYIPHRFEFTLDSVSSSNTWIHALYKLQKQYGIAFPVPVFYKDSLGQSSFFCKAAYLQEPRTGFSTEKDTVVWTMVCNEGQNIIGGNIQDDQLANILAGLSLVISLSGVAGVDLGGIVDMAQAIASKAASGIGSLFGG